MNYIVSVFNSNFFEFVLNAKIHEKKPISKNFTGNWVQLFESHVNMHEKNPRITLQGTLDRLNVTLVRNGVNFFYRNAFCKTCKVSDVDISHDAHSVHKDQPSQKLQIRGEDRVEVAEEFLLRFKGSPRLIM